MLLLVIDCALAKLDCGLVVPLAVSLVACGMVVSSVVSLVACGQVCHWSLVLWCVRLDICLSLLIYDTTTSFDLITSLFLA